jgi:hypothetical protein
MQATPKRFLESRAVKAYSLFLIRLPPLVDEALVSKGRAFPDMGVDGLPAIRAVLATLATVCD